MKPFLIIDSTWEDESLFGVRISASNGKFSGAADCYTNRDKISGLAENLEGYPKKIGDEFAFSTGERDDLSYFSLSLKCTDGFGHVMARVKIAHIVNYINQAQEKDIAEFDFAVEPSAIDRFVNGVKALAKSDLATVSAKLHGKI